MDPKREPNEAIYQLKVTVKESKPHLETLSGSWQYHPSRATLILRGTVGHRTPRLSLLDPGGARCRVPARDDVSPCCS